MTKVIFGSLKPSARSRGETSVKTKRIVDAEGKTVTMHVIDADSPTLGDDIDYVFRRNVARARRENKRLLGSPNPSPAPAKR